MPTFYLIYQRFSKSIPTFITYCTFSRLRNSCHLFRIRPFLMRAYLHPCATARIRVLSSVSLTLFACTIFVVSPGVIAQADGTENETYCGKFLSFHCVSIIYRFISTCLSKTMNIETNSCDSTHKSMMIE